MKLFLIFATLGVAVLGHPFSYPTGYKPMYPNEPRLAAVDPLERETLPRHFDARSAWPQCKDIIGNIRNQGLSCGSCWAMAATAVISDRICIATNGARKVHISAQDLLECCGVGEGLCGDGSEGNHGGCGGGDHYGAFKWFTEHGLVSGETATHQGACKPYNPDAPTVQEGHLQCVPKCENPTYNVSYVADHHFGAEFGYLANDEVSIMSEIAKHGPVAAGIAIEDSFYSPGVATCPGKTAVTHAVRIIGWGETEEGVKYWLIANSWGSKWGPTGDGLVKILRGVNECHVEEQVAFVLPRA